MEQHTHAHAHTERERERESNRQVMLCFLLPVSRPAPCVHQEEGWGAEGRVSLVPQISYWIYRTAPVRSWVCFCASGGTKGGPAAARQPGACPRTTPLPLQPLSSFTLESRGGSCQAVRPPADIFTRSASDKQPTEEHNVQATAAAAAAADFVQTVGQPGGGQEQSK